MRAAVIYRENILPHRFDADSTITSTANIDALNRQNQSKRMFSDVALLKYAYASHVNYPGVYSIYSYNKTIDRRYFIGIVAIESSPYFNMEIFGYGFNKSILTEFYDTFTSVFFDPLSERKNNDKSLYTIDYNLNSI
jgi:hypothetical protein